MSNNCPPNTSQKSLSRKLVPIPLLVSQSGEYQLIGSLSKDDGDVNENGKKALNMFRLLKQQLCTCIVTFFCTFR